MAGTPSSTVASQGQGTTAPGAGFANDFFNSLIGMSGSNPFPVYGGQIDPGLSPTLQQILQQAQGMSSQGAPSIFQGIQGSLGSFLNPQFQNPNLRIPQGFSDYFGMNPQQQLFGGQQLGSLGWSGPVGMPGSPGASDPNQPFSNVSNMGPGQSGGTGNPPSQWGSASTPGLDMSGRAPLTPGSGMATTPPTMGAPTGVDPINTSVGGVPPPSPMTPGASQQQAPPASQPSGWGGGGGGSYAGDPNAVNWGPAQAAAYMKQLMGSTYGVGGTSGFGQGGGNAVLDAAGLADPTRASGVQTAWDMGAGANRGQTRIDPTTGQAQIYMGTGQGGESYSWQQFNPQDYGQVQNAEMFQRYGNNWTSGGSGAADSTIGGHTALQPGQNQANVYDSYYGVH